LQEGLLGSALQFGNKRKPRHSPERRETMAEMAIEKPLTTRGNLWFHRHNPHRARGDKCYGRERTGEGSRIHVLERVTRSDIEQQLGDPVSGYELDEEDQPVGNAFDLEAFIERRRRKTLKKAAKAHRRRIRNADLRELDANAQEGAFMFNIESQSRHARERYVDIHARRRFLKDLIESLEELVANGAGAATQAFLIEQQIELCELESVLYAA